MLHHVLKSRSNLDPIASIFGIIPNNNGVVHKFEYRNVLHEIQL